MLGNVLKSIGVLVLAAFVAQPATEALAQAAGPSYATVIVDKLNVRAKGSQDAPLVGQLSRGDLIPVTKIKKGWVKLGWANKSYVFEEGVKLPEGKLNKKPKYEDMREYFIDTARAEDKTIQWLEVPRASGIVVRYHWREYRDKAALIKRAKALAKRYSILTTGETGIEVVIVNGNDAWAKAFY